MSKIEIYVAYHNDSRRFQNNFLTPIFVGKNSASEELKCKLSDMIGDDTGENISSKNQNYAELTAMYWIWKNSKADYKGLFHYRRFLNFKDNEKFFEENDADFMDKIGNKEEYKVVIEDNDLMLPKIYHFHEYMTIYEQYDFAHNIKDLNIALEILDEKYPKMTEHTKHIVHNYRKMYTCNLFVAKKEIYDDAMQWLFDILFELEKRIDVSTYDEQNKRVFGFLSERLLTIYFTYLIENQDVKYTELPVAMLYPKAEWELKIKGKP